MPKLWRGISGLRKQLDWLGMSSLAAAVGVLLVLSRTFEKDLNMTETETTTCPLSYIQAGIVASTGLPFNDIFAPI